MNVIVKEDPAHTYLHVLALDESTKVIGEELHVTDGFCEETYIYPKAQWVNTTLTTGVYHQNDVDDSITSRLTH